MTKYKHIGYGGDIVSSIHVNRLIHGFSIEFWSSGTVDICCQENDAGYTYDEAIELFTEIIDAIKAHKESLDD